MNFKAFIGKINHKAKQYQPELFMILGLGTMVAGSVIAVRNTYKKTSVRRLQHDIDMAEIEENVVNEKITEEEAKHEIKKVSREYAVDVVKYYAVPVTMEIAGITMVLASNHIMRKRVAGVTAAFTTVSTAFDAYRERVRERYGEDVERSIYLNEKQVEIGEMDEKGKVKKKTITVADPDISSIGRYFTRKNDNWSESEAFLQDFWQMQASYLTDKLRGTKGYVLLNEIYNAYGFDEDTEAGITVGKVYEPHGDNRIDVVWKKTQLFDEFGNVEDAYYIDWPGLEIIYGKGAGHRSIEA